MSDVVSISTSFAISLYNACQESSTDFWHDCQGGACPIEPSVAVEFDTYDGSSFGDNDLNCNHSSIQVDGQTNLAATIAGPSCLLPSSGTVLDGLNHDICITWNPFALQYKVYFDDAQILAYNGDIRTNFNSPYNVFWGFTACHSLIYI